MSDDVPKKILVVDDDDLLRDFYVKVIKSEGFEPISSSNGDEAIEQLKKDPNCALAIVDLLMPVRTGWELIEYMKDDDKLKDIPIIALTGLAASFDEFQKVEEICDGVMHKGKFELPDFIEMIKKFAK